MADRQCLRRETSLVIGTSPWPLWYHSRPHEPPTFSMLFQPVTVGHVDVIVHRCHHSTFGRTSRYSTNSWTCLPHVGKIPVPDGWMSYNHNLIGKSKVCWPWIRPCPERWWPWACWATPNPWAGKTDGCWSKLNCFLSPIHIGRITTAIVSPCFNDERGVWRSISMATKGERANPPLVGAELRLPINHQSIEA